jgi:hypothetical protein
MTFLLYFRAVDQYSGMITKQANFNQVKKKTISASNIDIHTYIKVYRMYKIERTKDKISKKNVLGFFLSGIHIH